MLKPEWQTGTPVFAPIRQPPSTGSGPIQRSGKGKKSSIPLEEGVYAMKMKYNKISALLLAAALLAAPSSPPPEPAAPLPPPL